MRLQYTYATSTYMYAHICIPMYVHSLVVKKDLRLRHEAIVRVEKKTVNNKKAPRNTGSARIAVCVLDNGQWI